MASERFSTTGSAPRFTPFSRLPVEIQLYIWELAGGEASFLWAEWPGPGLTLMAPLAPIPELGEADPPGLIPYILPSGMPNTLVSFPLPTGIPTGEGSVDWDTYERMMLGEIPEDASILARFTNAIKKSLDKAKGAREPPQNTIGYHPHLEHLTTCALSRKTAFRHAIVKTNQVIPANAAAASSRPTFYALNNGLLSADIFYNQRTGKKCFLFVLGVNESTARMEKFMLREATDPSKYSFTAAWLADIERCIFGHRLSLTVIPDELNDTRFDQLSWAMWWRPELGARARRPEANHPFYLPPEVITSIYSSILHRLVDDYAKQKKPCPAADWPDDMYSSGAWYFHLLQTGKCSRCGKPLMKTLKDNFSDLMDKNGHIDTMVLLDRSAFEFPQRTVDTRDHEQLY